MSVAEVLIVLLPLGPGVYLLALLRELRRAGCRNRAVEALVCLWLAVSVAQAVIVLVWPSRPAWTLIAISAPPLLISFGFLAHRVRRNPEALLSPATIARLRGWSGKSRGR